MHKPANKFTTREDGRLKFYQKSYSPMRLDGRCLRAASLLATVASCHSFLIAVAQAEIRYIVTDLGTLGGTSSSAFGVNASGQVTGSSTTSGNSATHAFVWSPT